MPIHLPASELLLKAAADGDVAKANALLTTDSTLVNSARDPAGNTPLHLAAKNGQVDMVKLLLAAEANIEAHNYRSSSMLVGVTALYLAVEYSHPAVVEVLLAAGASKTPGAGEWCRDFYLANAVYDGKSIAVVRVLLAAGTDLDAVFFGYNMRLIKNSEIANIVKKYKQLFAAARTGKLEELEPLLTAIDSGAIHVDATARSKTPLYCAAEKFHGAMVDALLKVGADIILAYQNAVCEAAYPVINFLANKYPEEILKHLLGSIRQGKFEDVGLRSLKPVQDKLVSYIRSLPEPDRTFCSFEAQFITTPLGQYFELNSSLFGEDPRHSLSGLGGILIDNLATVFEMVCLDDLSDEQLRGFGFLKEKLLEYICKLPEKDCVYYLSDALDKNTRLGKYFHMPRGAAKVGESRGAFAQLIKAVADRKEQVERCLADPSLKSTKAVQLHAALARAGIISVAAVVSDELPVIASGVVPASASNPQGFFSAPVIPVVTIRTNAGAGVETETNTTGHDPADHAL